MSPAAWGFLGLLVTQVVILAGMMLNRRDAKHTRSEVSQINRAVNHQPAAAPTLVQRVERIERTIAAHRQWEVDAITSIANHVGADIPPEPKDAA